MKSPAIEVVLISSVLVLGRAAELVPFEEDSAIIAGVCLIPLWLLIFRNLIGPALLNGRVRIRKTHAPTRRLLIAFVLMLFLSLAHGYVAGSLDLFFLARHMLWWGTLILFCFSAMIASRGKLEDRALKRAIYTCAGIYVALNIALWILGVQTYKTIVLGDSLGIARMLGFLGFDGMRTLFPMASGLGPFGVVSGVVMLFSVWVISDKHHSASRRIFGLLFLLCGLTGILMTDARGAMIAVVAVLFFSWIAPINWIYRKAHYVVVLAPLLPFIYLTIALGMSELPGVQSLARSTGVDNVATLSGRAVVWGNAFKEFAQFKPIHVVGFGARGQVSSGIGAQNVDVFSGYTDDQAGKSMHNMVLQYLVDMGYLGVAVFLALLWSAFRIGIGGQSTDAGRMNFLFLSYLMIVGTTELSATIYSMEMMTIALMVLTAIIVDRNAVTPLGADSQRN